MATRIDLVKKGKRTYGAIHTLEDGRKIYFAWRKHGEIFRSGHKSISDAMLAGNACWAIDDETLIMLRAKGIKVVGVEVRDTGDTYLTPIESFFDREKAKVMNYERRGGALQRYLPLQHFEKKAGAISI